jgi:hypothetical protein
VLGVFLARRFNDIPDIAEPVPSFRELEFEDCLAIDTL